MISRKKTRVEAIFKNIGQILVSVVTKHCQPPMTPSLGGDARVPRPGSRTRLPSVYARRRRRGPPAPSAAGRPGGPRGARRGWARGSAGSAAGAGPGRLPSAAWGGERLGAAAAGLGAPSPPARLRAPPGQGARRPARGRARPPGEEGPPPREQCGRCSAAPPLHSPRPSRRGPGAEGRAPLFGLGKKGERLSPDACSVGSSARGPGPAPGSSARSRREVAAPRRAGPPGKQPRGSGCPGPRPFVCASGAGRG